MLAAAVTSTTSQIAPQPAQAGDDHSPATMIEDVPFPPLSFSFPCRDSQSNVHTFFLVLLALHALQSPSLCVKIEAVVCAYIFVFYYCLQLRN